MLAFTLRRAIQAIAVMIAVFKARNVMAIFVSLGATLQARERQQAKSGQACHRDDVLAHCGILSSG